MDAKADEVSGPGKAKSRSSGSPQGAVRRRGDPIRRPTTRATGVPPDVRRDPVDGVTWPIRVAAAWAWRLIVLGVGVYGLVWIFTRIWLVAFSFILALFLTAVLLPLERRLRTVVRRPRSVAPLLSLLIGVAVLGGIATFVTWQVSSHWSQLSDQISSLVAHTKHWLQTGPLHLKSSDIDKAGNSITNRITQHPGELISGAITTVRAVSEFFTALLLILLSTFYLLRDGEQVWRWVVSLFPKAAQEHIDRAGSAGWRTFGGYMRGQMLIALFHGVTITILLLALRVPLAAALGVLIFLGSFVPLLGLLVTGALAVGVALLENGVISAVVVAIAIIVLVQVEGHLLQPFIMSRSVKVHPLAVLLGVVAGTTLGGIPGAFVAVPLIAFVNTTVRVLYASSKRAPSAEPADPGAGLG